SITKALGAYSTQASSRGLACSGFSQVCTSSAGNSASRRSRQRGQASMDTVCGRAACAARLPERRVRPAYHRGARTGTMLDRKAPRPLGLPVIPCAYPARAPQWPPSAPASPATSSASATTASVPAWRPPMAARSWPVVVPRAASACPPDRGGRFRRPMPSLHTFPRAARIRASADFARVFDGARRTSTPELSLHWLRDGAPPRLGLAVSRKVDPRAVVRNRIKRNLREQFRERRSALAPGAYVVVARKPAVALPNAQLRAAFDALLRRAGALPPHDPPVTMAG